MFSYFRRATCFVENQPFSYYYLTKYIFLMCCYGIQQNNKIDFSSRIYDKLWAFEGAVNHNMKENKS